MAGVRFTELQSRPIEFLDLTSLTLDEFQPLVPPFEAAFHARMALWRMDGKPRIVRRFTVYKNCPLPTPELTFRPLFRTFAAIFEEPPVEGGSGALDERFSCPITHCCDPVFSFITTA